MKNWQIQIGFLGGVFWMLLLFNLESLSTMDEPIIKSVIGYIMRFITVFSGYLFGKLSTGVTNVFWRRKIYSDYIDRSFVANGLFRAIWVD